MDFLDSSLDGSWPANDLPSMLQQLEADIILLGERVEEGLHERLIRLARQCCEAASAKTRAVSPSRKGKGPAGGFGFGNTISLTPSKGAGGGGGSIAPTRPPAINRSRSRVMSTATGILPLSPPGTGSPDVAATSSGSPAPPFPRQEQAPQQPVTFGTCIAASLYFVLESLMVRCEAQRLTLFVKTPSDALQQVINVGLGMPLIRRITMASTSGIVQCVFSSGIAANLDNLSLDDANEFEGPTKPKNALLFPVLNDVARDGVNKTAIGVIILINRCGGTVPFGVAQEQAVSSTLPTVSYLLEKYPVDHVSIGFDPTPIHRVRPLPSPQEPILSIPPELTAPYYQKIFHQNGSEKFVRRQALEEENEEVEPYDVTTNLVCVDAYIRTLEECWKSGIADKISLEKMLRVKQNHVNDAQEIFMRKQRRLDLAKEALREHIEKQLVEANTRHMKRASIAAPRFSQ